jgi:hypothetical protein
MGCNKNFIPYISQASLSNQLLDSYKITVDITEENPLTKVLTINLVSRT